MTDPIYAMDLHQDLDVFTARQAGREVAAAVGLEGQDLVRIATALSEVSRELVMVGGGRVAFSLPHSGLLSIELVSDSATARLQEGVAGTGVEAASRLVDVVTVDTDEAGHTRIRLEKKVAAPNAIGGTARAALRRKVEASAARSPLEELRTQNRELMLALEEAQARRDELGTLNRELEETNRGVMALYDELSGELETTNKGVVALYAEIDEKNRQLREASEAKTRFLRNISHELRTPGNSVLGLARLLLYSDERLTGEQRQQVELIESSALDLVRLVNELLDLARAESGRIEVVPEDVDLQELFTELEGTTRPLVTRPEVSLVVDDVRRIGTLRTDRTLLRHVLRNLLSNAVKFTEQGEVHMSVERDGDLVRIAVTDSGIGIAPEDQPHVFEEFFQVRNRLQAGVKGSGLGLPFAGRVAHILGGDLTLSSGLGEGSTFVVELPASGPSAGARGGTDG
jgi:signal transduction histidine kinase